MLFNLARAAMFTLDAETAHWATVKMWQRLPQLSAAMMRVKLSSPTHCLGLDFRNPVGVAAGLDKNGECITALSKMGFGFVEVGTVTPFAQAGNPRPRMFRLVEQEAVINRLGFNNRGVDYLCRQVEKARRDCVLGINIGKNATTPNEDAVKDYLYCLERVHGLADYVTVNISSPNTKDLRALQQADQLLPLLATLRERSEQLDGAGRRLPLLVKLAPDLDAGQIEAMGQALNQAGVAGVIVSNTTIDREVIAGHPLATEPGGLSGRPLRPLALRAFKSLRAVLNPDIAMLGVGGIHDQAAALERLEAGAELLQIYTGFVYRGPALLQACVEAHRELTARAGQC